MLFEFPLLSTRDVFLDMLVHVRADAKGNIIQHVINYLRSRDFFSSSCSMTVVNASYKTNAKRLADAFITHTA